MHLKRVFTLVLCLGFIALSGSGFSESGAVGRVESVGALLELAPLSSNARGGRVIIRVGSFEEFFSEAEVAWVFRQLDARGLCVAYRLQACDDDSLESAARVGRLQRRAGIPVSIDASVLLTGFFNGEEDTFHKDSSGEYFFDDSFGDRKMGCPFRLGHRREEIKSRIRRLMKAYRKAGVSLDFVFFDWGMDGPIEWNKAWEHSKRCVICLERLPASAEEDFLLFQQTIRKLRGELQRECAVETIKEFFPDALAGNRGVYPHDGTRYWYDDFELLAEGLPYIKHQNARYRPWYDEFSDSGYSFASPVVRASDEIWDWYPDFAIDDYRWVYNMLKIVSNAGKHTPPEVPIVAWVGRDKRISEWAYREVLFHMVLRGVDSFMLECLPGEIQGEAALTRGVYNEFGEWPEFLEHGIPRLFDVPDSPGVVLSALEHGGKLLLRRTDFVDAIEWYDEVGDVSLRINGGLIEVPVVDGLQLFELP